MRSCVHTKTCTLIKKRHQDGPNEHRVSVGASVPVCLAPHGLKPTYFSKTGARGKVYHGFRQYLCICRKAKTAPFTSLLIRYSLIILSF